MLGRLLRRIARAHRWVEDRITNSSLPLQALFFGVSLTTILVETAAIAGGAPLLLTLGVGVGVILAAAGVVIAFDTLERWLESGGPAKAAAAAAISAAAIGAAVGVGASQPEFARPRGVLDGHLVAPTARVVAPATERRTETVAALPASAPSAAPLDVPASPSRTRGLVGSLDVE